jgi:hypothetical protein
MTLAGPVASARADFGDTIKGGCGVAAAPNVTSGPIDTVTVDGTVNIGVMYVLAVSQHQTASLPSDATVTCWIEVNGFQSNAVMTVTDNLVPGVEAGVKQIAFQGAPSDSVVLCQQVTFADGSAWIAPDGNVGTDCRPVTRVPVPVSPIVGLFDVLKQQHADPVVCPVLVTLGQDVGGQILGGAVKIDADGDVFVGEPIGPGDIWVYDCSPYGDHDGSPLISNPLAGSDGGITLALPPLL